MRALNVRMSSGVFVMLLAGLMADKCPIAWSTAHISYMSRRVAIVLLYSRCIKEESIASTAIVGRMRYILMHCKFYLSKKVLGTPVTVPGWIVVQVPAMVEHSLLTPKESVAVVTLVTTHVEK
jgi:hypothetical protein